MDSKQSMGKAGENCSVLGLRMMEIAVERGIEIGVKAAIDYMEEERARTRKSRHDSRLHNTKLLLKHYRSFKEHVEGAVFNAKQLKESAIDILDGLDSEMMDDTTYVDGIKKSQQRTIIILKHIDKMLEFFRVSCEQSGDPIEMRRYNTIMEMYINGEKKIASEIGTILGIEWRTVYKDVNYAIEPLSALIFGVDSLKFM